MDFITSKHLEDTKQINISGSGFLFDQYMFMFVSMYVNVYVSSNHVAKVASRFLICICSGSSLTQKASSFFKLTVILHRQSSLCRLQSCQTPSSWRPSKTTRNCRSCQITTSSTKPSAGELLPRQKTATAVNADWSELSLFVNGITGKSSTPVSRCVANACVSGATAFLAVTLTALKPLLGRVVLR